MRFGIDRTLVERIIHDVNSSENTKSRARSRTLAKIVFRLFAIIALAIAAWLSLEFISAINRNTVTLPDGRRISLAGTAAGLQPFTTDNLLLASLRRYLPSRWWSYLPPKMTFNVGASASDLTVFLRVENSTESPGVRKACYIVEDSAGFRYPFSGLSFVHGLSRTNLYWGLNVSAFPRRESQFRLHLLDLETNDIATFTIQNPFPQSYPVWTPQPLPQTQSNGPISLRLDSLDILRTEFESTVEPHWSIESLDWRWRHAVPTYDGLFDATGNCGSILSPSESAWKLRAKLLRESTEEFGDNEKLLISGVTLPDDHHMAPINRSQTINGMPLHVILIAPPGEVFVTNGLSWGFSAGTERKRGGSSTRSSSMEGGTELLVESRTFDYQFLVVEVEGIQRDDELQLDYRIPGQEIQSSRMHPGESVSISTDGQSSNFPPRKTFYLYLNWEASATSMDLELRVSRPRRFEFLINPRDVRIIYTNALPTNRKPTGAVPRTGCRANREAEFKGSPSQVYSSVH